jgi:hypothetical protein
MEKTCFECGDPLRGRSDKKFCSDTCRNAYNNRVNCDANNFVRNVNNVLRRNRRILENVLEHASPIVSRYQLVRLGFDFRYFTHYTPVQEGSKVYYCYEFGYRQYEDESLCVVREAPAPEYATEMVRESATSSYVKY